MSRESPRAASSAGEASAKSSLALQRVEDLLHADAATWKQLRGSSADDFRHLEDLLLHLHFKRAAPFGPEQRDRILQYLALGYLNTGDVRYFNEFLWFDLARDHRGRVECENAFQRNLQEGLHPFPLATPAAVRKFIAQNQSASAAAHPQVLPDLRVALIGAPQHFGALADGLERLGLKSDVYYIPAGGGSKLRRWLKANPLVPRLVSLTRGNFRRYRTLRHSAGDPALGAELARGAYDIAIHKLSFIIRPALIQAFTHGILNDHLGVLPFVRGRSTLEYSLLYGFPSGATVHFIDEGVDTGDLVRVFTYPIDGRRLRTVKAVKREVLRTSDDRFLEIVRSFHKSGVTRFENPSPAGLRHYTMHPLLVSHIEKRILPT